MNLKILLFLFINLLLFLQVYGKFEVRKAMERIYEIYDDSTFLAYMRFRFINVAVLIELEWSDNAGSDFLVEFALTEAIRSPNNSAIFVRARKKAFGSEVKLFWQSSNQSEEIELECHYYALINKPSPKKVVLKLGPSMRFLIDQRQKPFLLINHGRNLEVVLYRLSFFGEKKQSTRSVSNYQLVYNNFDLQSEFTEDLFCQKEDQIERPVMTGSTSLIILLIVFVSLTIVMIALITYYIFKVRKYRISI